MSRKRWVERVLASLLALGHAAGCQKQVFMEPADYKDALMASLPKGLDTNAGDPILPSVVDRVGRGPADVLDSNRPARMVTLKECVAITLEQGNAGTQNFGIKQDILPSFTGRGVTETDAIRVFAIDPALASAELERSLSKFDTRWITSMTWQKVDQPVAAQFLSFQQSRDAANFTSTLAKPLPTGGTAGITFSTDYSQFNNIPASQRGSFVNPNYTPRLQFSFEQPLLRLFGVEANQLSPSHPGSQLLNIQPSGGLNTEGILISRVRVDQSKADFDARVNLLLVNVETAYWNLYAAYYNLYAQEEGMRQAFAGYRFIEERVNTGTDPPQNVDQSRAQFERFRRQVYEARGQVLDAERNLRGYMNLRSDDGTRLVPIDEPNLAAYRPDFYEAANDALGHRPELLILRQELKVQQMNLRLQKNLRRADIRAFGQYDVAGLGTRLDGGEFSPPGSTIPGNAFMSLSHNNFNSWTVGVRADVPIGYRDANAQVREAQLNLAKSYYQLRDSEMKALEFTVGQYRRVIQAHTVIAAARAEREALQKYLYRVNTVIQIGRWDSNYFLNYLTVQQQLATAIAVEFQAVANYNSALAGLEFAKGTIQQYNNVTVGEGPLPPWVQKKAADHIRERTEAALKLRERDALGPPAGAGPILGAQVGPPTGTGLIQNLPPFAEKREPLPELPPEAPPLPDKGKGMGAKFPKMPEMPPIGGAPVSGLGAGGGNARPWVGYPAPQPQPTPRVPAAADGAGDYFRPAGTVSLPPRWAGKPPAADPGVPASPAPPGGLPMPPAAGVEALPTPPPGGAGLPTPPPVPGGGDIPIPQPPEPRYPE